MTTTSAINKSFDRANDRCDKCGAAAKVRALHPAVGELLFCGHHGRASKEALQTKGFEVFEAPEDAE